MTRGHLRIRVGWPFAGAAAFALIVTGGLVLVRGFAGCEHVVVASSQEKSSILRDLAISYDATPRYVLDAGGICAKIEVEPVNSGDAELALEKAAWPSRVGTKPVGTKPDVWAPASSAWVHLLLAHSAARRTSIPADYWRYSLFQSPLVLAMPEPEARALNYPGRALSWSDIFQLAGSRTSGGAPTFLLGKTDPHVSTSGLHALIGTYAALGADGSPDAVNAPPARALALQLESSVVHYSQTAADLLQGLYKADASGVALSYVSAIPVEEQEMIEYDYGALSFESGRPRTQLIPVYLEPAMPYADHPFVILNSSKRQAALDFYNFLQQPAQRIVFDQSGFRLGDGSLGRDLSNRLEALGIRSEAAPSRVEVRAGEILDAELKAWDAIRNQLGK